MRKLIKQLTRKPRASAVEPKPSKDRLVKDTRRRMAKLTSDFTEARIAFVNGDLDLTDFGRDS